MNRSSDQLFVSLNDYTDCDFKNQWTQSWSGNAFLPDIFGSETSECRAQRQHVPDLRF